MLAQCLPSPRADCQAVAPSGPPPSIPRPRPCLRQAMVYIETSAKSRAGIVQSFDEIVMKILDTPELLSEAGGRATALPPMGDSDEGGACGMC
eukprot:scaffold3372_cov107-Isochrysis_galbana.AAC.3